MQESLTSKYNTLLSFRHEEVIIRTLKEYFSQFIKDVYLDCNHAYFFRPQLLRTQKGRYTSAAISNPKALQMFVIALRNKPMKMAKNVNGFSATLCPKHRV